MAIGEGVKWQSNFCTNDPNRQEKPNETQHTISRCIHKNPNKIRRTPWRKPLLESLENRSLLTGMTPMEAAYPDPAIDFMENSGPPAVEVWNADIPQVRGNSLLGPGGLVDQNGIEANAIQVFVDDALPVEEGLAASFTIRLSQPANAPVIVSYHTRDGSAIGTQADDTGDYRATDASNTLVFLPGETKKTVVVATNDDAVEEDTEHFTLRVTHATSSVPVRIADGSGLGTILDNDGGDELEEDFGDVFEEEVPVEPPIVVPHDDGDELPDPSTTPGGKPDVIDLPPSVSPNAFGTSLPQGPADGHVPGAPDPPKAGGSASWTSGTRSP